MKLQFIIWVHINSQVTNIIQEFKHNFMQYITVSSKVHLYSNDKSHLCARISIPRCSCKQLSGDQIIRYSLMSLANNKRGLETKDGNSFTYKANSRQPRTGPWGTHYLLLSKRIRIHKLAHTGVCLQENIRAIQTISHPHHILFKFI